MIAYYRREFCIGRGKHHVELFKSYTYSRGLVGEYTQQEINGNMNTILKALKGLTRHQKNVLHRMMAEKQDCIVLEDGSLVT